VRAKAYRLLGVGVTAAVVVVGVGWAASAAVVTERVSVSSAGVSANGSSGNADVAAAGRFVVFRSDAGNLVPRDTNAVGDVFLRDRVTGRTERISVSTAGRQGNQASGVVAAAVTPNGRYVAFDSLAGNLVARDGNGQSDVFIRDRKNERTLRVSVGLGGVEPNGASRVGAISANGRWVAFDSTASNLVGHDTNQTGDVFVRDRQAGVTTLVSVSRSGAQANGSSQAAALSADGHLVAFESYASNLVAGDTNPYSDVFVRDLATGTTEVISVTTSGQWIFAANVAPSISADGRYVVFTSLLPIGAPGGPWTQVWIRDRVAKTTTRVVVDPVVAPGQQASFAGSVSPDGRHVAFLAAQQSPSGGKSPGVYVLETVTGKTIRMSVTATGTPATGTFPYVAAADDGVVFGANSPDLVPGPGPGIQVYFRSY
jgi:Tol biopolymer transport system component